MTSKEVQKDLLELYRSRGIDTKITVVPDGCWIYLGSDSGRSKFFVNAIDYSRNRDLTNSYLKEVDPRLN